MPPRRRRVSGELELVTTPHKSTRTSSPQPLTSPAAKTTSAKKTVAAAKNATAFSSHPLEKYQGLLIAHPLKMNMLQSGVLSMAGNVIAQILTSSKPLELTPILEQLLLGAFFIAPIVSWWFTILGKLNLHWLSATFVDQFCFSPLFNIAIFMFLSAFTGGGLALTRAAVGSTYSLTLALDTSHFPSLLAYEPVHSTQVKAYLVWLPATLAREKLVPPHLAPLFVNVVSFFWNIIFSVILLSS